MKSKIIKAILTELEKEKLMGYAGMLNMTISDYIKYCCLISPLLQLRI